MKEGKMNPGYGGMFEDESSNYVYGEPRARSTATYCMYTISA